jgi:hypothetical protein
MQPELWIARVMGRYPAGQQGLQHGPDKQEYATGCNRLQNVMFGCGRTNERFKRHGKQHTAQQNRHDGDGLYGTVGHGQIVLSGHFLDVAIFGG